MKKDEFIKSVATKTGLSQVQSKEIINTILETLTETLQKKETVSFRGFGTFTTSVRKGKEGKVPGSNQTYKTEDKVVPKFKPSKNLNEKMN